MIEYCSMETVTHALTDVESYTGNFLTAVSPDTEPNVQEMYRTTLAAMMALQVAPLDTSTSFLEEAEKLVRASAGFLPGSPEGAPRSIDSLIIAARGAHDIAEKILHKLRGSPSPVPKTDECTPGLLDEPFVLPEITEAAVVDDEIPVLRMNVRKVRKLVSTEIQTATNGGDSLDALLERAGERLEVLFLDNIMPGRHGTDVIGSIRSHPEYRKIVVVFLTANKSFDSLEDGLREWQKLGFDGFLHKDFDSPTTTTIHDCLAEIFQRLSKSDDRADERRWVEKYRR
jgi:CheY-like chemotaxis protein